MNALFLAGNSLRHKAWIHEMADALGSPFDEVVVHDYKHWETGEQWIDIDHEIDAISTETTDLAPYIVYAKSIGTMVALKAMYEKKIKPKSCVFLGLPLNAITDMNLPAAKWLAAVDVPMYFLHNDHDPYGSAAQLCVLLEETAPDAYIKIVPGDTHDYLDTEPMAALLSKALQ